MLDTRTSSGPPPDARWRPRGRIYLVIRLLGGRSGGAERLFCEMANMFADEGYEVTCFYCDSTREPPFYPLSPKVSRVNLWGRTARQGPAYAAIDRLAQKFDKGTLGHTFDWLSKNLYFLRRLHAVLNHGQPDAVISFLPPANTPTLLAGLFAGAKVVPTNHNVPEQDYRSPHRWDQNPIDRSLRFWSLYAAQRVHVLFPTFAYWFPDRIYSKATVITNYVSRDFEDVIEPQSRCKEIVAVGRLAGVKNYMALIDAWSLLQHEHPDWTVKIYGVGPQRRDLGKRIQQLELESSVKLMGHETNIKDVYLRAELFCHPAVHEGFGLSAAEALACGLPVVAFSDCDGVNEFVKDGYNGLMVDRSRGAEGLAEALARLIHDENLRRELRGRARDSITRFSEAAFRHNWLQLVDEIISEPRRL